MKNKVTLIGRVGQDPEVKQAGGSTVAKFTLATSEKFTDKAGEKQEKTQWHNLECWGKLAENVVAKYVRKGSKIDVEGKIEYDEYTDKEGVKKKTTKITVRDIVLLDGKPTGAPANETKAPAASATAAKNGSTKTATSNPVLVPEDDGSDLPF